jgi:hypothetical protein
MRPLSNSLAISRIDWTHALRGVVQGSVRDHRSAPPAAPPSVAEPEMADVEVSVRIHRDGTQVTVMRRTVADDDGRRTVGFEAVIR